MKKQFHYLVRGIIIDKDHVLLAHEKGANNTFLPGGHINIGEKAKDALCREISEEIGKKSKTGRFFGAIEHAWLHNGIKNYEINLIFDVIIEGLSMSKVPFSCENHLEFFWVPVDDLQKHNLLPSPMAECIQNLEKNKAYWDSTL